MLFGFHVVQVYGCACNLFRTGAVDHSGGADAPCLGGVWGEVSGQLALACCTTLATQGRPPELHGAGEQFNL